MIAAALAALVSAAPPATLVYAASGAHAGAPLRASVVAAPSGGGWTLELEHAVEGVPATSRHEVAGAAGTQRWTARAGGAFDVTAVRQGNALELRGRDGARPLERRLSIDEGPWVQDLLTGLGPFARSGAAELRFWTIGLAGPSRFHAVRMKASRLGTGTLDVAGRAVEVIRVRVAPYGLGSLFWHADLAFAAGDGRGLRYEGSEGEVLTLAEGLAP